MQTADFHSLTTFEVDRSSKTRLYDKLKSEAADEYQFSDGQLNRLGYAFLQREQIDAAIEVFEFNLDLFPEVANCYDSLGEAYLKKGDTGRALENYRRALELDPSIETARAAVERLTGKD